MNLIIKLLILKDYNVICIIINHFLKERHYVLCYLND